MANNNSISLSFTSNEVAELEKAIEVINRILSPKCKSLTPEERQQYGRVKYEKEIWIEKVKTHIEQNPDKVPNYIDHEEFLRDFEAHKFLNRFINILETQYHLVLDTNLLLGYDLDVNSLMFYRNIKVQAEHDSQGARTIYDDLKQQFQNGGRPKTPKAA